MLDKRALDFYPCLYKGYSKPLISCLSCKRFPCKGFEDWRHRILEVSPFVEYGAESRLVRRRSCMVRYEFVIDGGTKIPAYSGFDPKNPDWKRMRGVIEVEVITQVLVPQIKLVPKPATERSSILAREAEETPTEISQPAQPVKTKRRRKGA